MRIKQYCAKMSEFEAVNTAPELGHETQVAPASLVLALEVRVFAATTPIDSRPVRRRLQRFSTSGIASASSGQSTPECSARTLGRGEHANAMRYVFQQWVPDGELFARKSRNHFLARSRFAASPAAT